jgi:hypothetical protein
MLAVSHIFAMQSFFETRINIDYNVLGDYQDILGIFLFYSYTYIFLKLQEIFS